jgi:hypothetical protein
MGAGDTSTTAWWSWLSSWKWSTQDVCTFLQSVIHVINMIILGILFLTMIFELLTALIASVARRYQQAEIMGDYLIMYAYNDDIVPDTNAMLPDNVIYFLLENTPMTAVSSSATAVDASSA